MPNLIDVGSQLVAAGCLPLIKTAITVVFQVGHTNIDTVDFVGEIETVSYTHLTLPTKRIV